MVGATSLAYSQVGEDCITSTHDMEALSEIESDTPVLQTGPFTNQAGSQVSTERIAAHRSLH